MGCVNQSAKSKNYLKNLKESQRAGSNISNSKSKSKYGKKQSSTIKGSNINSSSQLKHWNGESSKPNSPKKQSVFIQDRQNTYNSEYIPNDNNKNQIVNSPPFQRINHPSTIKDAVNEMIPKLGSIPGAIVNQHNFQGLTAIPFPSKYGWVQEICQQQYQHNKYESINIPSISLQIS